MNNAAIWTVTRVNEYIENKLYSDRMLSNVLVSGEISNFARKDSGHMFFTLKDSSNAISAVMFSGYASRLSFEPKNGMKVIVTASVSIYKKSGYCQLKVTGMQPDGLGAVFLATEQLREKLAAEGIFAEEHKKPIPEFPQRIGLVMGAESAALSDVIEVINNRYPLVTLIVFPTLVEGDGAPASICQAVKRADKRNLDLIILGRGGGSIENLIAFNDESVVRCVYDCNTPIITAVGHNINTSLSDLAADLYLLTPTAAAERAVPDRNELLAQLSNMEKIMEKDLSARLDAKAYRLDILSKRMEAASPVRRISFGEEKLLGCQKRMSDLYNMKLQNAESELSGKAAMLEGSFRMKLQRAEAEISERAARLDSMSPLKTLSRGYSLVYKGDRLVNSVKSLSAGDDVEITLADGKVSALIK